MQANRLKYGFGRNVLWIAPCNSLQKYHVYDSPDFSMLNAGFVSNSKKAAGIPAYSVISFVKGKVFQVQKNEISKLLWIS